MNVKLRTWRLSDAAGIVKHANNYNVAQYLTDDFPFPYTFEDAVLYIGSVSGNDPVKVFAIDVDGEAVGSIGIFPQAGIYRKNAEIGYWLSEEYWGRGIMLKAIKEIVRYGFNTFDITRIFARPFAINIQSQKVLQKAGFVKEATFQKSVFKNNEYMDEVYFSVCRSSDK